MHAERPGRRCDAEHRSEIILIISSPPFRALLSISAVRLYHVYFWYRLMVNGAGLSVTLLHST